MSYTSLQSSKIVRSDVVAVIADVIISLATA